MARTGRTLSLADTIIAAVALGKGLTLITDNVKDFPTAGLRIFELTWLDTHADAQCSASRRHHAAPCASNRSARSPKQPRRSA